jgi:hypothetical protein
VPLLVKLAARAVTLRCAVCHDEGPDLVVCAGCATRVHAECRPPRCPTLGCVPRAAPERAWLTLLVALLREAGHTVFFVVKVSALGLAGLVVLFLVAGGCVHPGTTPERRARATVDRIRTAATLFLADHRRWPEGLEELRARDYIDIDEAPVDPWGRRYRVRGDRDGFIAMSWGPDGLPGGGDDIQ